MTSTESSHIATRATEDDPVPRRRSVSRSRWAAIGAAIAVTLGAGSAVRFVAAVDSEPSSIISITPVRILDTRDPVNLGLAGPFTSATGQNLQVTGSVATPSGAQTVVPAGATGVLLNVTAVLPTADGFVSVRPAGTPGAPTTSSLNFEAGAIVPNAVFVAVPTTGALAGQIELTYDAFGAVGPTSDMLVDVVGYTTEAVADAKTLSLPITGAATENADFNGAQPGGLRLLDNPMGNFSSVYHSFVIPPDYTTGTPIAVELSWVISAACQPDISSNNMTVLRPGIARISGASTGAGLTIEPPKPATANIANSTVMTIVSPNPGIPLEPGDAVTFGLFRRGDGSNDTCTGAVLILTGIEVQYQ